MTTTAPLRLIVADDHAILREGLIEMLNMDEHFTVVGDGATAHDAIALSAQHRPDVALLDVGMPGPSAADTIRAIHEASPETRVVIVTMFDDPRTLHELIEAGASAYLLKNLDRRELTSAVRSAARSDSMVTVSVSRQAILGLPNSNGNFLLSQRESEVIRLVALGKNNQAIAAALTITPATVKRHLSNIYTKLEAKTRTEALYAARKLGIVED
jgi:DNA-binding NarL/FixJ family response regulator